MNSIIEALPGIQLPIPEISRQLRDMWKSESGSDHLAPSEFRASQLNLIIHFGSDTTVEEAKERFTAAIEFTQKYPGRIIVLAPSPQPTCAQSELRGKLFTQCYIGENQREMCCCEALLLEYAPKEPHLLFNQVSIWLESDLPVYHWFHRISVGEVKNKYLAFVKNSKRVLFDSSFDASDFSEIPSPNPWRIRDLADARILPLKQSLGQVLSTIEPSTIVDGLEEVCVSSQDVQSCHLKQLANWIGGCLEQILKPSRSSMQSSLVKLNGESHSGDRLTVEFRYKNGNLIRWGLADTGKEAVTTTRIGNRSSEHHSTVKEATPDQVLAEAIFFGV
jgi:hypothetical protein